jgi:hypothetical protein
MRRVASFFALLGVVVTLSAAVVGTSVRAHQEDTFPHDQHQGLFPLCTGCHAGIASGVGAEEFPTVGSCDTCHDGVARDLVVWNGPSARVDNVDFDHVDHTAKLAAEGEPEQTCAACHIPEGGERMAVSDSIQVGMCWACHVRETDDHFAEDASCETCHVPLASTSFSLDRIAAMPRPLSHEDEDFVAAGHGSLASASLQSCATCHTQEVCATCHVDLGLEEVASMPPTPAGMIVPRFEAQYPVPATHTSGDWQEGHQADASFGECSTCHTSDDCRSCHVAPVPDLVAQLPSRESTSAPGVMLSERSPESHESVFFLQAHSALAATDQTSCTTCHVDAFCVACHDGEPGGGYHPANFMVRHSSSAYGRDSECSSCHEEQLFCRACHVEVGLAGPRVAAQGYHDASPVWLLRHGQAARQNIESCSSCHRQVDCTRCHGVLGSFKVSPHSARFDAERAWARSPRTCLACHVGNPLNGRLP